MLRRAGLRDVQYRPVFVGVRSGDPWQDYLPATVESLRGRVVERGQIAAEAFGATVTACRAHLADPDTVFTGFTVVQVWGRAPEVTQLGWRKLGRDLAMGRGGAAGGRAAPRSALDRPRASARPPRDRCAAESRSTVVIIRSPAVKRFSR